MAGRDTDTGLQKIKSYPLLDALLGRRSRRFFLGAEVPDGVFKYRSEKQALPLTAEERSLVLAACGGNTGWHNMIYRGETYVPHLSNYAGSAGGRTFPSAAGFHTGQLFYTDDTGVYFMDMRDAPAAGGRNEEGLIQAEDVVSYIGERSTKIQDGRLDLPPEVPHVEAHNTWVVNRPGTLLVVPVADLAQHVLLALCYLLQNNTVITDDINRRSVPGIESFGGIVDVNNAWPLRCWNRYR